MNATETSRLNLSSSPAGDAATVAEDRLLRMASGELSRAYRLAGLILGNAHEAEDATQDALIRAWRSLGTLRDPDGFGAWFDRILVNACRDRLRQRRLVCLVALDGEDGAGPAPDPFDTVLHNDQVLRAMVGLNSDERTVLVLHYWADLPLSAVAERLGWPAGTVKTRLHKALEKMRVRLDMDAAGKAGRA